MQFHDNLSSGIRIVPCGRIDRQTHAHDMTNLTVALCYFAKALKMCE